MKPILILMSIFSFLFGSNKPQNDAITILDKSAFKTAINAQNIQLIDVRTASEYNAGSIKNAKNIDFFNQNNFIKAFNTLNKEEPVYIYCRSGARSQKAAKKLTNLGFKKIYDLKGGYMNWN